MQLSFVMSSLQLSGGVQVVVEYANRLAERHHNVTLVTPHHAVDREINTRISSQVVIREGRMSLKPRSGVVSQIRLAFSLAQLIPADSLVIATHTPTIVPVLMATRGRSKRRIWLYMDYPEMFAGRPMESWLLRHGPRWFDVVLTLSAVSRLDALGAGARHVEVIGLGLTDADWFSPSGDAQHDVAEPIAMYLGDERPRKGLAEFLSAAENVRHDIPNLRLLIVSKEPIRTGLPVACEVVLKPERRALPGLYRAADVFVSPSWSEGFGLPPLEAMACGVPVVLTDSRGVREFARSGENCLLVQPHDVEGLAGAMQRVLIDADLAHALSAAGVATATQFQWDVCVDRLEAALRAVE